MLQALLPKVTALATLSEIFDIFCEPSITSTQYTLVVEAFWTDARRPLELEPFSKVVAMMHNEFSCAYLVSCSKAQVDLCARPCKTTLRRVQRADGSQKEQNEGEDGPCSFISDSTRSDKFFGICLKYEEVESKGE